MPSFTVARSLPWAGRSADDGGGRGPGHGGAVGRLGLGPAGQVALDEPPLPDREQTLRERHLAARVVDGVSDVDAPGGEIHLAHRGLEAWRAVTGVLHARGDVGARLIGVVGRPRERAGERGDAAQGATENDGPDHGWLLPPVPLWSKRRAIRGRTQNQGVAAGVLPAWRVSSAPPRKFLLGQTSAGGSGNC